MKNLWLYFLCVLILLIFVSYHYFSLLIKLYNDNQSAIVLDRKGEILYVLPNNKNYFTFYRNDFPSLLKRTVLMKEDKFFYYHFGLNPLSTVKYLLAQIGIGHRQAQSTITQQLVKILLSQENKRSIKNKLIETFLAFNLELFASKERILDMYLNSVYFGNNFQGVYQASLAYFGKPIDFLSLEEIIQLVVTLSNPNNLHPLSLENLRTAKKFAKKHKILVNESNFIPAKKVKQNFENFIASNLFYDINPIVNSNENLRLTIDKNLNLQIKKIVKENIEIFKNKKANHVSGLVIKLPENEILAAIGSPDFSNKNAGAKINMLTKPRAVGSTIKPFIYLLAFENGLRPYSLVEDREYKYISGFGFPYYPKNFDQKHYGVINLSYALANSLNVPALKTLEFVGLKKFDSFFNKKLGFKYIQNLDSYQLSIAMGTLEMSLIDLAKYFTIFPNQGWLTDLKIISSKTNKKPILVTRPEYIALVNKILADRNIAVDQFGIRSHLNLNFKNYAVKTGTSNNFKDSWAIGYTPDFLVAVWVGNPNYSSMDKISGVLGAGKIWSDIMNLMFNSEYNKNSDFEFSLIKEFRLGDRIEYGLEGDDYQKNKYLLIKKENLILKPFNNSRYLLDENSKIFFEAREDVIWLINDKIVGRGKKIYFQPLATGTYNVEAFNNQKREKLSIEVVK